MTALHLAAQFKSSASVVRALIEAGANVNARTGSQNSPLHYAALCNPEAVPLLLKAGADPNMLNSGQWSPLAYAAENNFKESVIALCAAGADPRLGKSPLEDSGVREGIKDLIKEKLRL